MVSNILRFTEPPPVIAPDIEDAGLPAADRKHPRQQASGENQAADQKKPDGEGIQIARPPDPIMNPNGVTMDTAMFLAPAGAIRLIAAKPAGKKHTASAGWMNTM
jgi:hypothetical protein